jgi:hypothetical protein
VSSLISQTGLYEGFFQANWKDYHDRTASKVDRWLTLKTATDDAFVS